MPNEFIPPQPGLDRMEVLRIKLLANAKTLDEVLAFETASIEAAKQVGVNSPDYETLVETLYTAKQEFFDGLRYPLPRRDQG